MGKFVPALFLLSLITGAGAEAKNKTIITGEYPEDYILIYKPEDIRFQHAIKVYSQNGHFRYELETDTVEAYSICSEHNYWEGMINYFFSEDTELEINFRLAMDDDGYDPEIIAPEGTLSHRVMTLLREASDLVTKSPLYQRRDSLMAAGAYYSPELTGIKNMVDSNPELMTDSLREVINSLYNSDNWQTPEGKEAEEALAAWANKEMPIIKLQKYVTDKSLAGLFLLYHEAQNTHDTYAHVEAYEKYFKDLFPGHPYSTYMEMLAATYDPVPGKQFIDFEAPDFDGNNHKLSDLIKGKPAFLDLWASSCGPCRKKSIAMIPVYEKFAPMGFTIVGVAREFIVPLWGKEAIEKDGYKWLNLLELNDSNQIYARYRRANAMGATFLIDDKGTIVAIDPTPEEVGAWLDDYYGKSDNNQ